MSLSQGTIQLIFDGQNPHAPIVQLVDIKKIAHPQGERYRYVCLCVRLTDHICVCVRERDMYCS